MDVSNIHNDILLDTWLARWITLTAYKYVTILMYLIFQVQQQCLENLEFQIPCVDFWQVFFLITSKRSHSCSNWCPEDQWHLTKRSLLETRKRQLCRIVYMYPKPKECRLHIPDHVEIRPQLANHNGCKTEPPARNWGFMELKSLLHALIVK